MHANVSCSFFGQVVDTVELSVLGAESPSDCGAQTEVDLHGKNTLCMLDTHHAYYIKKVSVQLIWLHNSFVLFCFLLFSFILKRGKVHEASI